MKVKNPQPNWSLWYIQYVVIHHLFVMLVNAALNHSHSESVEGTSDGSTGMGLVSQDTLTSCAPQVSLSYYAHHSHGCTPRLCWDTPPNVPVGRGNMTEVHKKSLHSQHEYQAIPMYVHFPPVPLKVQSWFSW